MAMRSRTRTASCQAPGCREFSGLAMWTLLAAVRPSVRPGDGPRQESR